MDFSNILIKDFEKIPVKELLKAPVFALAGITKKDAKKLQEAFSIKTIEELAKLKYVDWAQELLDLAFFSEKVDLSKFENKLIKKYEKLSLSEIIDAKVDALQGISAKDAQSLKSAFYIETIRDLANWKYARMAKDIFQFVNPVKSADPMEIPLKIPEDPGLNRRIYIFLLVMFLITLGLIVQSYLKDRQPAKQPSVESTMKNEDVINKNVDQIPQTPEQAQPEMESKDDKTIKIEEQTKDTDYYIVKRGDTLNEISKKLFGKHYRWKYLYRENKRKIKNPNNIYPGLKLKIPEKLKKYRR